MIGALDAQNALRRAGALWDDNDFKKQFDALACARWVVSCPVTIIVLATLVSRRCTALHARLTLQLIGGLDALAERYTREQSFLLS